MEKHIIIDGKAYAAKLREKIADIVAAYVRTTGRKPGLAVVLVGEDPASDIYVRSKGKATRECGMNSYEHRLPADTSQADLVALVEQLNRDDAVDGILVQLPLPAQINDKAVISAIDPAKDVDGFHVINAGRLAVGEDALVPCTPHGSLLLIKSELGEDLTGLDAVVVGRSNIVGKPMAQLLLQENCTVTLAHSKTRNLPEIVRRADIIVAAVGRAEMVRGDWIKPGAVVIDVGINRTICEVTGKKKLVGDVATMEAIDHVRAITPVPGGVGPMTITCLLRNTVLAAFRRAGLNDPEGL